MLPVDLVTLLVTVLGILGAVCILGVGLTVAALRRPSGKRSQ